MSSMMLDMALAYARKGWRVFPLHGIRAGRCTCGKPHCQSPGKHPRTRAGFKDATTDSVQITRWWNRWLDSNIGGATGSGLAVVDVDGAQGFNEFKALLEVVGTLPETLVSKTGNGFHFFFSTREGGPEVRNSARGHVHVRGEGGYVVLPPSIHYSGKQYQWVKQKSLAEMPDRLRQWTQGYEISARPSSQNTLGQLPAHLAKYNQRDTGKRLDEALATVWSPAEQARLESALNAIDVKACSYNDFVNIGFALSSLNWDRSDGTSIGFDLWDRLCSRSEHYNPAGLEEKWKSFGRRSGITIGTIYHIANQHGWNPALEAAPPKLNGHHVELPKELTSRPIVWPDVSENGKPRATAINAGVAIAALGVTCRKDLFHEKFLIGGQVIDQYAGDLSDEVLLMLRKFIRVTFGFDPGDAHTKSGAIQNCLEHQFDPILDYLDSLKWDGMPRLDSWMQTYLQADSTEYIRYVGRLALIAAVRRARKPGTKFDQIIVLESPEGYGKSEAIEILAGKENFSDQNILAMKEQAQQEALTGIWLYEMAELSGLRRTDIEHVKAFASRTWDRARPAYGRFRVDRPRRTILFASTNDDEYLRSETGNRRFWPVRVGRIDKDALRADRDQLWAEAAHMEAIGNSITLPERLWKVASEEQDKRMESDMWLDMIHNYLALKNMPESATTREVLVSNPLLQVKPDAIKRAEEMRAARILRRLGYKNRRCVRTESGGFEYRYFRHRSGELHE